ncbi:MAG: DUF1800 domain-containing protein [Bacteroidota bacterium]
MTHFSPLPKAAPPPVSVPLWDRQMAVHLFRRMAFGADYLTIQAALAQDPLDLIDDLIQTAQDRPLMPEPAFANKIQSEYGLALLESVLEKDGWTREWIMELQLSGLRGRMSLFWHNHFVTRFDIYESASYAYQYHRLLETHALGNFKTFVYEMGLTPAMLIFLNGSENVAGEPNENYAREVYELFTLGVDNGYTQTDIEETARALTGYTNIPDVWGPIFFDPNTHDDGVKTIFGQTGNWGYDEVVDLLFEQRPVEISTFIARKLYAHFVNPEIDEAAVSQLATVFRQSNWEIAELLRALFKSEQFFDPKSRSTQIYGHVETKLIYLNELGATLNGLSVFPVWSGSAEQGQALFNPVDVAGWPGNRSWINTTSITYRWDYLEQQIGGILLFTFGELGNLARSATDETLDVEIICRDLVHYFLPQGLQFEEDYEAALITFKGETPPDYFTNGNWTIDYWALPIQVAGLLRFLVRLPEFQLK